MHECSNTPGRQQRSGVSKDWALTGGKLFSLHCIFAQAVPSAWNTSRHSFVQLIPTVAQVRKTLSSDSTSNALGAGRTHPQPLRRPVWCSQRAAICLSLHAA